MKKYFINENKLKNKIETVKCVMSSIEEFIYNKDFISLIKNFDKEFAVKKDFFEHLESIVSFTDVWDYRKKQSERVSLKTGERARWLIDEKFDKSLEEKIFLVAKELGLIGNVEPVYKNYDYILVLGGGRETNILRPRYAKMLIDKYKIDARVIGLSCERLFDTTENTEKFKYRNGIKTEYEALEYGFEMCFDEKNYKVLNAPSSDKRRRANSKDTYKYFFETEYEKGVGNKILLISSQIYAPYQSMGFMAFSIENSVAFDIVGYPYYIYDETGNYKHAEAVKYLQEFRSTVLEIKNFCKFYNYGRELCH